jgi:DNA-directed RNA polymerase subunit RPC12/RpoP
MEYKCIDCGKPLKDIRHRSLKCRSCGHKGILLGEKGSMYGRTREKSTNWRGGISFPKCVICGKNIWRGYTKCRKCSRRNQYGDKNPMWKGGITPLNEMIRGSSEYKNWRISVFIRDKFTCKECGKTHTYLEAHHIKPFAKYPDLRFDINNGQTLCSNCHNITKIKI